MKCSIATRVACLLCLQLALGCADAHDLDAEGTSSGLGMEDPGATEPDGGEVHHGASSISAALERACMQEIEDSSDGLPQHLRCTGLYADLGNAKLGKGVQPYTPGIVLWSDGAEKHRWISLPEGEKIDASKNGDWVFPVGTKLFKEFAVGTRRVETRLFQKVRDDRWVRTTYAWDDAGSDAVRSGGGDLAMSDGSTYHIPTPRECDQCHQGRKDRVLGFEAIGLGVDGAEGLTLAKLVDQKLLDHAPGKTHMQIADDGSGKSAEIVGWIHMNCGVSCHNDNPSASAHSTKLRLRLSPDDLAGPASDYPVIKNTVDVDATTVRWKGQKRIVPGSPEDSLLYNLVASRMGKNDQMPPIATRLVDQEHLDALRAWIENMPAN